MATKAGQMGRNGNVRGCRGNCGARYRVGSPAAIPCRGGIAVWGPSSCDQCQPPRSLHRQGNGQPLASAARTTFVACPLAISSEANGKSSQLGRPPSAGPLAKSGTSSCGPIHMKVVITNAWTVGRLNAWVDQSCRPSTTPSTRAVATPAAQGGTRRAEPHATATLMMTAPIAIARVVRRQLMDSPNAELSCIGPHREPPRGPWAVDELTGTGSAGPGYLHPAGRASCGVSTAPSGIPGDTGRSWGLCQLQRSLDRALG